MTYMLISGLVALIFGLLLLLSPKFLEAVGEALNVTVMNIDSFLRQNRTTVGLLFLAAAAWVLYVALNYPGIYQLHLVWILALVFGVLYIFYPQWLEDVSHFFNVKVFPTDKYVMDYGKMVGLLTLVAGAFILAIGLIYKL